MTLMAVNLVILYMLRVKGLLVLPK